MLDLIVIVWAAVWLVVGGVLFILFWLNVGIHACECIAAWWRNEPPPEGW